MRDFFPSSAQLAIKLCKTITVVFAKSPVWLGGVITFTDEGGRMDMHILLHTDFGDLAASYIHQDIKLRVVIKLTAVACPVLKFWGTTERTLHVVNYVNVVHAWT